MSRMLRKQIYIDRRQERLLKRKAAELRVSESELIRDGIEKILRTGTAVPKDIAAWKKEKKFIRALMKKCPVKGGRTWRREEGKRFNNPSKTFDKTQTHSVGYSEKNQSPGRCEA